MENKLNSLLKRDTLTSCSATIVEVMVPLVLQPHRQLLQNSPFLAQYEAFKLVRLKSPMENKPSSLRISSPTEAYKGMVVQLVENFAD